MSRTCFVIMPFSSTESCSEQQWTWIFENVLRSAVEGAGLDYECRRSSATRGNIVGGIVRDLNDAYLVVADLTDTNPNVFYELGVRHALTDRSIILAQKSDDIPFDLRAYAYHVYDWRSEEGREALRQKLHSLLEEVERSPTRPDNPVSDFLKGTVSPGGEPLSSAIVPQTLGTHNIPWPERPGGPQFRLSPRLDNTDIAHPRLLCQFRIAATPTPGGVKARWIGPGVKMDWVTPMPQNVPANAHYREYQMKAVLVVPTPPRDEVTFEVRFNLEDGSHWGRWRWPLNQHPQGHWRLDQTAADIFQPKEGDYE